MTYTDDIPPPAAAPPAPRSPWESCDHCQAPLDERQRYCVACGARRAQADDPVARYFVTAARQARAGATPAAASATPRSRPNANLKTALVFALLPLVAGIGILVGRGGSGDDDLLLEALKSQKAPVVNVGSGGGSVAEASSGGKDKGRADSGSDAADGEVIARTRYGSARKLTGAKVTPEQIEESKKALDKIVNSKGKEYVEQQRGLPDQIVIP